jgi:DNA repair exonuclease SbcCD ATPase subunit
MKTINAPDLHIPDKRIKPEWHAKAIASLTTLAETVEREKPALLTIPGDLWHGGIQNSDASGFPTIMDLIQRILNVCPIAAVAGTGSHDPIGAYKALTKLKAAHPFFILEPDSPIFLGADAKLNAKLMILGCPEPTREWLLAGMEGKDAAEVAEKMKASLRGILLGFGALRAQYPDIPCVFLFHGAVDGATMQNGQTVGAGEIKIGREDLQLIAGDITARYGGNAYPKEWGELGQVGFDIVDLQAGDTYGSLGHIHLAQEVVKGRKISVTRIDYPHPRRIKAVCDWKDADEPLDHPIDGVQVWQVYRATKEEAKEIDPEEILHDMRNFGALEGSRVTVETILTDAVRAPEIASKNALREKVIVYAEAYSLPVTESILVKADQLECEAEKRGETQRTNIIIHSVELRGAKGIYKGRKLLRRLLNLPALPLDNIKIDFDKYEPGILGLLGPTGAGKTTILGFLAPYTDMPGRRGPLRNHFRLRDSSWQLIYSDEYTGNLYRTFIEIDGVSKDGKANCHLFVNGEPINSGAKLSIDDYEQAIRKLFGSPELFVRCSNVAQKNGKDNPDLSDATKGERSEIVVELAGLDYLQSDSKNAKEKAETIEGAAAEEGRLLAQIEGQLTVLPDLTADRSQKAADLEQEQNNLRTLELRGLSLKSDVEQLAQKVAEQRRLAERIAGLEDQVTQKQRAIRDAADSITEYQQAVEWAPEAQKVIVEWDKLKEQENAETRRLSTILAENARLQGEYNTRLTAHHADVRKVEGQQSRLRTEKAVLEGNRKVVQNQIDFLARDLNAPLTENCPTCGQRLPETKLAELQQKRAESEARKAKDETNRAEIDMQLASFDQQLAAITLPPALPPLSLPPVDQEPLRRILTAMAVLKIDQARKNVATAQEAATRIEEAKKQLEKASGDQAELGLSIQGLQSQIDPAIQPAYDEATRKLEGARAEYGEAQKAIAGLEAQIQGFDKRIAELQVSEEDLGLRKVRLDSQQACAAEWRWLQRACGREGIQSLELDYLKPGIEATANDLLSSVFGSRFSVEFRTERMAGRGSDIHEKPDFSVWIIDNEDNASEQEFFSLSGGESVPVRLAIYEAFARMRVQKFSPMTIDEADGHLDPSLRAGYVDMIERARIVSRRRNTLLVSHSVEVQEMIAQKIDLARLAKESQPETAA